MTEEDFKMEKDMLIQGQKNLEKEKEELADEIIELTKQIQQTQEKLDNFENKFELLKQRLPRFAKIIDIIFREDEEG